jgi:hypothetical protein
MFGAAPPVAMQQSADDQSDVIEVIGRRADQALKIDRRTYQVQQSPHSQQKDAIQLLRRASCCDGFARRSDQPARQQQRQDLRRRAAISGRRDAVAAPTSGASKSSPIRPRNIRRKAPAASSTSCCARSRDMGCPETSAVKFRGRVAGRSTEPSSTRPANGPMSSPPAPKLGSANRAIASAGASNRRPAELQPSIPKTAVPRRAVGAASRAAKSTTISSCPNRRLLPCRAASWGWTCINVATAGPIDSRAAFIRSAESYKVTVT